MRHYFHNSLRALFLSLAVLLSLPMLAVEVEIDWIRYDLNAETKQATVIKKSSGSYWGEVVIPASVEHEGTAYSVTSIGDDAFYWCYGLTSVTIPNSVKSIGEYAFAYCYGLTSVTIGNSVESIGEYAFAYCSGLTPVTIPNSVTSIGEGAFEGCSGLRSVTIPNSVTSIGDWAFVGCSVLTWVHISDIAAWCNIEFGTFPSNPLIYAHHLYLNGEEVKDLVIPNSVTSIGDYAFALCDDLTSVTIGNSVTSIGSGAFEGCDGLTSVTIPNSVTSIGEEAFHGCDGLTSVTIGSGVEVIGYKTFADCTDLLDVYCYAEKVPSTESDAFSGSYPEYATLHVPDGSIESYKTTEPWSGFGKIMGLSGEQPEVEKCATPVVSYADGKLSMACETEGAVFITNVVAEDAKKYYDAEIEFSATYNIEVYASKANFENSDTVSVALVWVENGDVNEETGVISVPAAPVLVQGNGGVLSVSGVAKGTDVVVYTISGTEVARATATEGTTTISTGLQSGTIAIVKFGNKSVKIKI